MGERRGRMSKKHLYARKELAVAYFPKLTPASATKQLTIWIDRDDELYADLKTAGFQKGQRIFTPRQIEILFAHLGEPGEK